jgi:hypothetical protein
MLPLTLLVTRYRGVSKSRSKSKGDGSGKSVDILKAAKELVKNTQKKTVITETKKFAGQEIR